MPSFHSEVGGLPVVVIYDVRKETPVITAVYSLRGVPIGMFKKPEVHAFLIREAETHMLLEAEAEA